MRLDAIDSLKTAAMPLKTAAAVQTTAPDLGAQPVDREAIRNAVKTANEIAVASDSAVEFSIDGENGGIIVRVLDSRTKELIRQFPSEDMLKLRHALETLRGLMLDKKA